MLTYIYIYIYLNPSLSVPGPIYRPHPPAVFLGVSFQLAAIVAARPVAIPCNRGPFDLSSAVRRQENQRHVGSSQRESDEKFSSNCGNLVEFSTKKGGNTHTHTKKNNKHIIFDKPFWNPKLPFLGWHGVVGCDEVHSNGLTCTFPGGIIVFILGYFLVAIAINDG